MTLSDQEIIKKFHIKPTDKILDVGGSMMQHEFIKIDTLVDFITPEESPYTPSKLLAKNFVRLDILRDKLPFKDNEFDFCLCTQTLEDLPFPFPIMDEMSRVAKRGYITTPSMGRDLVFSHFNLTDWLTGSRRVPGYSHHKWMFYKDGNKVQVLPKNYGILYSSNFHFVKWLGDEEFQHYWENNIEYREIQDFNLHVLIGEYKKYINANKSKLVRGLPLIYLDNPIYYLKEVLKLILKKGRGFNK